MRDPDEPDEPTSLRPSHAERQAPGDHSQRLARKLLAMDASLTADVPMPDRVREVLDDGRAMKVGNARRRQERRLAQFIRDDDMMEPLQRALDELGQDQAQVARSFKRIEEWRDALVDERAGLEDLARATGTAPSRGLVEQVALARDEAKTGRHRGAGRALFRLLSECVAPTTERPPSSSGD